MASIVAIASFARQAERRLQASRHRAASLESYSTEPLQIQVDPVTRKSRIVRPSETRRWAAALNQRDLNDPGPYVPFPTAGVELKQPVDFVVAKNFRGFELPDQTASIVVTGLAGSFSKAADKLADGLKEQLNWVNVESREVVVDQLQGLLLSGDVPIGTRVGDNGERTLLGRRWMLMFGDEELCTSITATCDDEIAREAAPVIERCLLSSRRIPLEIDTDVGFTLDTGDVFQLTPHGIGKILIFTTRGKLPSDDPDDPMFMAYWPKDEAIVGEPREAAIDMLYKRREHWKVELIRKHAPVNIDGHAGYETEALASSTRRDTQLIVYQVMLQDKSGGMFLMFGTARQSDADEWLPEFRRIARSFRRVS